MNQSIHGIRRLLRGTLVLLFILVALPGTSAWAEKPDWAGGKGREGRDSRDQRDGREDRDDRDRRPGRDHREDRAERSERERRSDSAINVSIGFGAAERGAIEAFYREQAREGKCPPGLAKKNNGCLPPGQAKAWRKGQPLPSGVVIRDLSPELRIRLPLPPVNHRYVELAGDILLVAIGSAIVVDAVENILR